MKTLQVSIRGLSPLLMHPHRPTPEGFEKLTPEAQAEFNTYRDEKTQELYIPCENLSRALVAGAAYSKGKGRASLQKVVAACVLVSPIRIGLGTEIYAVDGRGVVIPATRGRVMRYRPRIEEWKAAFQVDYDETLLSQTQIERVIADTGTLVGLLDFRPEKKGPYGRFAVEKVRAI